MTVQGSASRQAIVLTPQETQAASPKPPTNDKPISAATKLLNRVKNFMACIGSEISAFSSTVFRGTKAGAIVAMGYIASLATCCLSPLFLDGVDFRHLAWEAAKRQFEKPAKPDQSETPVSIQLSTMAV